jgi:hypothetical protein
MASQFPRKDRERVEMLSAAAAIVSLFDDNSIGLAPAELQQTRLRPIFVKGRHCGKQRPMTRELKVLEAVGGGREIADPATEIAYRTNSVSFATLAAIRRASSW